MPENIWTIGERTGEVTEGSNRKQLPYREELEIADKMPKGQIAFAHGWNEMRKRLLELGEMKSK